MTPTDPTLGPDLLLRQYTWALLKYNDKLIVNSSPQQRETWDELNYGGLIPIVPLSDEPELNDFDGPHIVYGYTGDTSGDAFWQRSGTMTFAIYDDNFRRLGRTLNVLETAFSRADHAAHDVNRFCSAFSTYDLKGIRFGCIYIGFMEGGIPETQEGGRQSALFNIRFDYFVDYNVTTELTGLGQ